MNPHARLALAEYERRKERAGIDVANRPGLRAQAEANLRAWLAVVLLAGGDHPDAAPALAPYRAPGARPADSRPADSRPADSRAADGWSDAQARAAAASWLAPRGSWAAHLVHAVTRACADAETASGAAPDAPRIARARALLALARHLDPQMPATAPAEQRKAA